MEAWVREQYSMRIERLERRGMHTAFWHKQERFLIIPADGRSEAEMEERQQMSRYLRAKGVDGVGELVKTTSGTYIAPYNGQPLALVRAPLPAARFRSLGRELAVMHECGRTCPWPIVACRRIGQWRELWAKRIDQMEAFWSSKLASGPSSPFDRLFIESFPYYLGMAENAVQYVADTELDEEPVGVDCAAFCHERLPEAGWVDGMEAKLPTDWVYDHCARDLAEWVRHLYQRHGMRCRRAVRQFFQDYGHLTALSPFAWRLIYARLLFPLPYFECVEAYYTASDENEQARHEDALRRLLERSHEYERFLASFAKIVGISGRIRLPAVEWLPPA
ncbi:Spore coat protein S [Geobacillus proteiniphilus]|uniref:Spore coat protein S n=1 Tax=Geobacillus proteiniphilus TaxID=860353 RepID=A0A1Q5STM8_9BACL|nr:spore coat protein YutH [Geobacillus proteiniphilus]OKO91354.1 Spore coat protein S [Geobacillus proteiniphilus]